MQRRKYYQRHHQSTSDNHHLPLVQNVTRLLYVLLLTSWIVAADTLVGWTEVQLLLEDPFSV